jgi:hypothetical protein
VACAVAGLASCDGAVALAATTPFSGTPVALPGQIDAEKFDNGGEGVAYHDTTSGNSGGQFRNTDVDIEAASEGGFDVGWAAAGEWLNYTVNVAGAGTYTVNLRVASPSGASMHVGFNTASDIWKVVSVPNTGGWQNWTTVSFTATLGAGTQQMTILFDTGGMNLRNVVVSSSGGGGGGLSPYLGTPVALPGTVQSANFDNGGESVAYHDTTPGNTGGAYRATGVDIEPASDGGYDVGWIAAGEWLNYTVNVGSSGAYVAQLRVASPGGAAMHVGFNAASHVWSQVSIPATGGWQSWTTVNVPVTLGAGQQQMTLLFDTPGLNIESINVTAMSAPPPPSTGGGVVTVNAGGDLQAAINNAQPGDTIVLQAGATFTGNFVLPDKSGSAYVTITSSGDLSRLPAADTRIDPSDAPLLAKIKSPNGAPAIATAPFAHHYQLQLLELPANFRGQGDVIQLGDGSSSQNTLAAVPHDLVVDRVYIHGDPTFGQKRGIALNSASTTVRNSYIAGIVSASQDAQAICGWNGPGPFTIANNYLEASGENLLFGGTDPAVPSLVPSDITIRRNQVSKPLAWRGQAWIVKNLLEFKNAQRVVVDGNILENNWQAGQSGYAVLFTPRNQGGAAPWSVVQQIQFTNNVVRHVAAAISILGNDDVAPSQQTNGITIRNNLFEDVSSARYGGTGWFVLIIGALNVTVDHNTVFADGTSDLFADGPPSPGFDFTNNIVQNNAWAIMGNSASPGNGTIAAFFPGSQFLGSVIAGASPATYPGGNFYPANLAAVEFRNLAGGNYRLAESSPYIRSATDGTDVGANIDAINATAGTQY